MARRAQNRSRRLLVAMVGSAAILLAAPGGAWAGSAHHSNSRHGHHGKHASAASHDHGSHKGHRAHGRHRGHRGHDYRHGYRHRYQDQYFCKPCGQYFGGRDGLYGHVSGHHGVPFWQISFAIANNAFGLTFYD